MTRAPPMALPSRDLLDLETLPQSAQTWGKTGPVVTFSSHQVSLMCLTRRDREATFQCRRDFWEISRRSAPSSLSLRPPHRGGELVVVEMTGPSILTENRWLGGPGLLTLQREHCVPQGLGLLSRLGEGHCRIHRTHSVGLSQGSDPRPLFLAHF